jgi:Domain of unknown function (DUF4382)
MKTTALVAGAIAAIIAVSLIAAAIYIPGSNLLGAKSSNSSSSTLSSTTSGAGSGSFSVLMTDPPTVPYGVTDVYMTYNKVGVHIAGDSNDSGWQILTTSGTIDLMQSINVSQTIATANLQNGEDFNALGFNITQVIVTYNNGSSSANYTADLIYGQSRFFVPIPGGITVNTSENQAVMIDMTPRVLLLGSPSNPTFAFLPSARGYVVPNGQISAQSHPFIGDRVSLQGNLWWRSILENTSFSVSSVQVSPSGLAIAVQNTGSVSIVFHFAAVTGADVSSAYLPGGGELPAPVVSDIFVVESNASLVQLASTGSAQMQQVESSGYLLAPGQSVTFTYSGNVLLGMQSQLGITHPVISGQSYIVRLFGNGFVAAAGTTASDSTSTTTTG